MNDNDCPDRHGSAINALGDIGDQAIARHLVPWLNKSQIYDRDLAASALAKIKDPDTVGDIIKFLKDVDQEVRLDAVIGLGWTGNDQAVQPLIELLGSSDGKERKKIIQSLIAIGSSTLEKVFLEELSNPDPEIQFMAAKGLLDIGWEPDQTSAPPVYWAAKGDWKKCREFGPQAIPVLVEAWKLAEKDQSYDLFYTYTAHKEPLTDLDQALVEMKPESILPLIEVFKANRSLRFPLMRVFIALKEVAAEPLLILGATTDDGDLRSVCSQIHRNADHSIIVPLQKLTTHPEKIIRQSAIKVLGWHPDPLSLEPVVNSLMQEEDPTVRGVAAETLGLIGGEPAAKALVQALQDSSDHVREVVAIALSKLKDPSTTEAIIALLKDDNPNLRILAIKALGNIGGSQARDALEALKSDGQDYSLNYELDQALKTIAAK